jgi:hypothetical protein
MNAKQKQKPKTLKKSTRLDAVKSLIIHAPWMPK